MFVWREDLGGARIAFTDRNGGVSESPYGSLNLSSVTGDRPARVTANWELVCQALGVGAEQLAIMRCVHGNDVLELTEPPQRTRPAVDGLVTRTPGVVLVALVADCAPVMLVDAKARIVGAAHAGRPGLAAGIVAATVERMRSYGADSIVARVGPCVCGECYEVPQTMQDEIASAVPAARSTTRWGTPGLDIGHGVLAQLTDLGIEAAHLPICTMESPDLYSHRRDGRRTGRMAGLVWLE